MDAEMIDIFRNMLREEIQPLKMDINEIKTEINGMKSEISDLNTRLTRVEEKTDNNTVILEDINNKIKMLAEGQSSFQEQIGRSKNNDNKTLNDRLEVIELAVTDTSSMVRDIQKDLVKIARTTGENWADIIELKYVK